MEFFTLYIFNFKNIVKSTMIKLLFILVLISPLVFSVYTNYNKISEDIDVTILNSSSIEINDKTILKILDVGSNKTKYTLSADGKLKIVIKENKKKDIEVITKSDSNIRLNENQVNLLTTYLQSNYLISNNVNPINIKVTNNIDQQLSYNKKIIYYIIIFVMYLFILIFGNIIISSVALEQTSKTKDLLIYKVSPLKILYSKVTAIYTAFLIMIVLFISEVYLLIYFDWLNINIVTNFFKGIKLPINNIILLLLTIVAGVVIYTSIYIIIGLFIHSTEQIQFAQFPVVILLISALLMAVFANDKPDSVIANIGLYIPVFTPFLLPLKIINEQYEMIMIILIINLIFIICCNLFIIFLFKKERK